LRHREKGRERSKEREIQFGGEGTLADLGKKEKRNLGESLLIVTR